MKKKIKKSAIRTSRRNKNMFFAIKKILLGHKKTGQLDVHHAVQFFYYYFKKYKNYLNLNLPKSTTKQSTKPLFFKSSRN
jgi:hypothetical protein